nr:uncharacterized protein LOC128699739 [Cherax quadricarinatus]
MPKPALDFEVVNGPDSLKEGEAMVNTPFNLSEGPLWQVRLMPLSSDYSCLWPEVKEKFPYQNKVLFNFHHGIVDGPVLLSITGLFMKLLEDYISKIPIDKQQFGQLVDHSHTSKIVQQMTEELERIPKIREAGIIRDIYNISSLHPIDLRRYMKGYSEIYPMGFHTLSVSHTMATPYNVKDIFWEYVKQFDTENFPSNLKNKQVLRDFALRKMTLPDTCNLDHLYATPSPPKYLLYLHKYVFTKIF